MPQKNPTSCPLCGSHHLLPWTPETQQTYWRCTSCALVFLDPCHYLSLEDEQAHYCLHENDPYDAGYRGFLARITQPLLEHLAAQSIHQGNCLDFGCGPGSAVAAVLEESGHHCTLYDPQFAPDTAVMLLNTEGKLRQYNAIACTEVVEHLQQPMDILSALAIRLKQGGVLAIMTGECPDDEVAFARWHYRRDPTHIVFFSSTTWQFVAEKLGLSLQPLSPGCLFLKAPYT